MKNAQIESNAEIDEIVSTILSVVPALEIYIFGSFANGTATEDSDYDFYVVIPDGLQSIEIAWKITGSIRNRTRGLDMIVGTKSKFDKYKHVYSIEKEVANKGVKLYG
jgi:predicted nucleotidyltransferase